MSAPRSFPGYGIELEYMIVDATSLDVAPLADRLLLNEQGEISSEVEHGPLAWSNELMAHVVELKTNGPASSLEPLAAQFSEQVRRIDQLLASGHARLMPTAMHPWMNPDTEAQLWPHEYNEVYRLFDTIFNCSGHGWANLQSMHINLPFRDDAEFAKLHAAIRFVLPILPALAASSPIIEGRITGKLDNRLDVYRHNAARLPSVAGRVVPEAVASRAEYQERILEPIYRDVAPFDPGGVLRHEWVNSRGAIARFMRDTIEIRVLDVQEAPQADLAIAAAVIGAVELLLMVDADRFQRIAAIALEQLEQTFLGCVAAADEFMIDNAEYLAAWGVEASVPLSAGELWRWIVHRLQEAGYLEQAESRSALEVILTHGSLSRRILGAVGTSPSRETLHKVYGQLCECLAENRLFIPD